MGIYTLEVAGRAVACIRAETPDEAEQSLDDPWFRDGLLGLGGEQQSVWSGNADVGIREATSSELALIADRPENVDGATVIPLPAIDTEAAMHRMILASRVEGTPAFNPRGEQIGHIADLSIDRRSGQVAFALMSFGGFLGIGKRFHPVPWQTLRYDHALGGYIVALGKDDLANAPHYGVDELRELGGAAGFLHGSDILEYYGRYAPPVL